MYARVELTRQVFKIWKWKVFTSGELFVGPFKDEHHRNEVIGSAVHLSTELLRDKPYVFIRWKELEHLPKGTEALDSDDDGLIADFIVVL